MTTQSDIFTEVERTPSPKSFDLWIAGAIVLAVVFVPALLFGLASLLTH